MWFDYLMPGPCGASALFYVSVVVCVLPVGRQLCSPLYHQHCPTWPALGWWWESRAFVSNLPFTSYSISSFYFLLPAYRNISKRRQENICSRQEQLGKWVYLILRISIRKPVPLLGPSLLLRTQFCFLLQRRNFLKVKWLVPQSCPTLCDLVACQAPLSMEFSRQGYWSGLPFPSPADLPDPGIQLRSPTLQADSLLSESLGKLQR